MRSSRHLALVAALAAHGHFGRAARALGLSQPALTKALKSLEDRLGVTLFDRGPPVAPTAIGALVVARARALSAGFEDLQREVALARGLDTGALVVSAGGHAAEFAAIDAVAAFSRAHPFIDCVLNVGNHETVTRDVLEDRADLGICHLTIADGHPLLHVERLRRASYTLFCRKDHPLTRLRQAPGMDILVDYPWIGASAIVPPLNGAPTGRHAFGEIDGETGLVRLRLQVNSFESMLRIVMKSDAVSGAPVPLIAPHVAAGRLAVLTSPYGWPDLDYGIVRKRGRTPSPAAEAYMTELRRLEAAFDAA